MIALPDTGGRLTAQIRRNCKLIDVPALLPSLVVAAIHFKLCVMVEPYANVVFQHWFDTGERAAGADAVIASINNFLTKPIPTILLANHPVSPLPLAWWLATAANSILWGAFIYACYILPSWLFKRLNISGQVH
ncbi:MAG: hypothetical protein ACJ741_01480 [Pyrinomonadaceae bacterium]